MFKYKLLISFFSLVLCLTTIHPTFASDMKLYRNDNEYYSILVPNDWEYQDVNKIDDPKLKSLSLLATSKLGEMIYIKKNKENLVAPVEDWTDRNLNFFIQGVKRKVKNTDSTFIESGETYINKHKSIWIKSKNSTQELLSYAVVNNDSLYYITYVYPINCYEKSFPKITESINNLKFDNISPNWYWITSNDQMDMHIDTNNIETNKDVTTNTIYKTIIAKTSLPTFNYFSYIKLVLEFKLENNIVSGRILSMAAYDSSDKFINSNISLHPASAKEWKNVTTDESMSKIADLLFEKNQ